MDHSLLLERPDGEVEGVLVEEFARAADHTTVGLSGSLWTRAEPRWLGASAFSRAVRTRPDLLARVVPTDRAGAADAYRRLGGGDLPAEADLRAGFVDRESFATAAPLRLGPAGAPPGYHERRVYRVLFAKDLDAGGFAALRAAVADPPGGTPDHVTCELRRVGRGVAVALDVTVLLAGPSDTGVGPVLRELTGVGRRHGLLPVTTERFA